MARGRCHCKLSLKHSYKEMCGLLSPRPICTESAEDSKRLVNRWQGAVLGVWYRYGLSLGRASHGLPVVGKQLAQPGDGVCRDAREHVAEPGKRLDAAPLAGSNEAPQHGRRLTAAVAAEECPVAA